MQDTIKNRLMIRLVSDTNNLPASAVVPARYKNLSSILDLIEKKSSFFNEATLETDEAQYKKIKSIVKYTFKDKLINAETVIDLQRAEYAIDYINHAIILERLPKHDYYHRTVSDTTNATLVREKEAALEKLSPLVTPLLKANGVTVLNPDTVKKLIQDYNAAIKALPEGNARRTVLVNDVKLLNDWVKIALLKPISIPQDSGEILTYCTLEESAGGVTEKVSLISVETALKQLQALNTLPSGEFNLNTEAILKLPKHGDIKEVQREMMALNISRLLGHKTTASTMVTYHNQPALFIPFERIRLLSDYTTGQTFQANYGLIGNQTYTHYSTVNPVGEGLHQNQFLDDFGNALGLIYLASDTDVIGGYGQNKAIYDDKVLYIFDTVLMAQDKLGLDSRLSTEPVQLFMKHTRHGQGRNRTVIEDGDFTDKFNSILALIQNKPLFTQYMDSIIKSYQIEAQTLSNLMAKSTDRAELARLKQSLNDISTLRADAEKLKIVVNKRVDDVYAVFPKWDTPPKVEYVRQAMLLEKMINMPRLFTDDGRPYRHPWTNRNTINIGHIKLIDDNKVELTFKTALPNSSLTFLRVQQGATSARKTSDYTMVISIQDLLKLNENTLYKEHLITLTEGEPSLSKGYMGLLQHVYESKASLPNELQKFITAMDDKNTPKREVLVATSATIDALKSSLADENSTINKGLNKHLLKKVYYDAALYFLSNINDPNDRAQFEQAFKAAAKLDRIEAFHQAAFKACENANLQTPEFKAYLDACIALNLKADTHTLAIEMSQGITILTKDYVRGTKLSLVTSVPTPETAKIDPRATLIEQIDAQQLAYAADIPKKDIESTEDVASIIEQQPEGITVK